jgi:8-oxo-dGTP pyrophosphatase MutT (NUDIX family)
MSDPKIIFQNNYVEISKKEDSVGIKQKNPSVLILPYTLSKEGNPVKIGLISEPSPIRETKMSYTVISGTPDKQDVDILATAKRELKEESGIEVEDTDKWEYLGNIFSSKLVVNGNPAFGVDVTGIEIEKKEGDGSDSEEDTKFELVNISEAIAHDDALISCLFLKIFQSKLIDNL